MNSKRLTFYIGKLLANVFLHLMNGDGGLKKHLTKEITPLSTLNDQ